MVMHTQVPVVVGWQISDFYRPARQVGGDLYDYFELPVRRKRLGLVIVDVADKGVSAALFMAISRSIIRSVALAGLTPGSILTEANRLIVTDILNAIVDAVDSFMGEMEQPDDLTLVVAKQL